MKKLICVIMALCLSAVLWGCGGQKSEPTTQAVPETTQTVPTTVATEPTRATGEVEVDFSAFE